MLEPSADLVHALDPSAAAASRRRPVCDVDTAREVVAHTDDPLGLAVPPPGGGHDAVAPGTSALVSFPAAATGPGLEGSELEDLDVPEIRVPGLDAELDADACDAETAPRSGDRLAYENALVEEYLSLADRIARRMAPPTVPVEDFVQAARLALVQAARRFEPARGVPFPGYASVVVAGRLKHYLRDVCWDVRVPRGLQETWLRAGKAREGLTHRLGRAPTVAELAADLGVDEEHLLASMPIGDAWTVTRFEGIGAVDEGEAWEPPDRSDAYGAVDERLWLREALHGLPERLQRIVHLYYVEERPQRVIAEEFGVSQMQISRLLARAVELLRREAMVGV